jgi:hypothetical protein
MPGDGVKRKAGKELGAPKLLACSRDCCHKHGTVALG